jgi:predicted nicotinamide N-methyase
MTTEDDLDFDPAEELRSLREEEQLEKARLRERDEHWDSHRRGLFCALTVILKHRDTIPGKTVLEITKEIANIGLYDPPF